MAEKFYLLNLNVQRLNKEVLLSSKMVELLAITLKEDSSQEKIPINRLTIRKLNITKTKDKGSLNKDNKIRSVLINNFNNNLVARSFTIN